MPVSMVWILVLNVAGKYVPVIGRKQRTPGKQD